MTSNMRKIAVITGATSGIGASFAKKLASHRYDLIITGRRKTVIQELAAELSRQYKINVKVIIAELADPRDVQKVIYYVKKLKAVDILINNAGFGLFNTFIEENIKNHEKMVKVHLEVPVLLTHAVLPQMIKNKKGTIINVSSLAAFTPLPRNTIYCGTKSFLNLFSECLHLELKKEGIKIQALCPGFTRTDFHEKLKLGKDDIIRLERFKWMSADSVVEYSLKSLGKDKVICIPGFWNKLLYVLASVLPRALYYRITRMVSNK